MLWFVWSLFALAQGFNLDTKSPIFFKSNNPGDYFGFSVALHRNRDGPMALVGAPRANSSTFEELHQPGVLYKCDVERSDLPCQEIVLDTKGNSITTGRNDNFNFMDKKDDMWLGVSLDIQRNSKRNDIVTCGHLWKNQLYKNHYLANGACYVINEDLDQNGVTKLVPFVDKSKQSLDIGIYKFAMGQLGTSAAFSEDGKYLLLGAPGYYDWTGTVASYALNPGMRIEDNSIPAVPSPSVDRTRTPQSYIGYSVTSGKFYDDGVDYVAVGAPRDGDFLGRVYIYKAVKSGEDKLLVHQKKEGVQFGEYFGAAVLGMDLNGDGYTDLLVGSPLYSSDSIVDKGKVYVFISNKMGLQLHSELYSKTKTPARFGTALANAGDLNQDGFNDFVIGAPYEDGNGAVYIYHGSEAGINDQYVQRISAAEIDSSLSGFGIQVSRGFDIDVNQYPDILVGSYASSNAVLFRSQPVVKLFPQITFSPNQINTAVRNCAYQGQNLSCVNVTVCLWYAGKHVPMHLEFQHELFVELTSEANLATPRGFFVSDDGKSITVIKQKSILDVGDHNCFKQLLHIRNSTKDVITPIQLLYRYNLLGSSNSFNKSHPIMDPLSTNNITSSVTFQTGCGSDDKCLSDLRIKADILGQTDKTAPMIIGRNSTLSLSIIVDNIGEPAYLSELLIYLPPELPSISIKCSEPSEKQSERNATFVCDLGNLLLNQKAEILVKLDLDKIPNDKKELHIYLTALTASTEVNAADNFMDIPLFFKAIADISITGSPSQEQIPYDGKNEGRVSIPISHTYFVMNHGPSPVQVIDIKLWIPTSFEGKDATVDFVTFTNLEADSGKPLTIPAKCNDTYLEIKPGLPDITNIHDGVFNFSDLVPQSQSNNSEKVSDSSEKTTSLDYSISDPETSVPARFRRSSEKRSTRKRKDVAINCETAKCMVIECSASPFIETRKFAKITASLLVNMSVINEYVDPWFRVEFVTRGEVTIRDDHSGLIPKHHHPDKTEVKTVIVSSGLPPSEEVDQWIIFVSIGIGILLLLIILALLIKFGFFKREQKEKMEKMKSKADCKDYDACEGESTESEALN